MMVGAINSPFGVEETEIEQPHCSANQLRGYDDWRPCKC